MGEFDHQRRSEGLLYFCAVLDIFGTDSIRNLGLRIVLAAIVALWCLAVCCVLRSYITVHV